MATTTNYGWTTPNDTDLVKDGAAAIRTLGSSIDTTTKALNPSTTLGDIEYRSATANTNTRLALGTAGQVLTVNSGATAPEWAAVSATSMTLLSTTSLSGTSTTISSISGSYTNLMIIGKDVDTGTTSANINLRFNGDSGSNYRNVGYTGGGTTNVVMMNSNTFVPGTDIRTGGDPGNFVMNIYRYTDTSKIQGNLAWDLNAADTERFAGRSDFRYNASAAITSFTVTNSNSQSMTGTIYIYGVK
jgi:hypothetical protein